MSSVERQNADVLDVLIVGAGPTGMVMALCLARRGVRSVVIERHAGINEHPKAHELNARSIEILDTIGISLDRLEVEASPRQDGCRIAFCQTINEEFGEIDLYRTIDDPEKYQRHLAAAVPYLNISQTEVERLLHAEAASTPEIDLRMGHQWQSLTQDEDGVACCILDRDARSEYELRCRWLIAADGAGSRIRDALAIGMDGPESLQDVINAYFELGLRDHVARPAKLYWILEPSCAGAFIAHHIDRRWVYNVPIATPWEQPEDFTEEILTERIRRALGTDAFDIRIKSTSVWRMTAQIATRWSEGRVFLAGDAAHRFPPTGGLGMNTGIGDAHNLAWKIAAVLNDEAPQALLATYESERRPTSERNAAESHRNFEGIFDVIESVGLPRDGAEGLARIRKSSPVKWLPDSWVNFLVERLFKRISGQLAAIRKDSARLEKVRAAIRDQVGHFDRIGLDIGYIYEHGALVDDGSELRPPQVTHYVPSARPGARFAHLWLHPEREEHSSHDLVDYNRWTLLTAKAASPWGEALTKRAPKTRIDVVCLDEIDASDTGREALRELCGIGPEGALLLRPDGHVAWRTRDAAGEPDRILTGVMEACCIR